MGAFIAVFLCMVLGGVIVQVLRAEILFFKIRKVVDRAEAVLSIIEGHGKATDAVAERVVGEVQDVKRDAKQAATVAAQARDAVAEAVAAVPEKVVERLTAIGPESSTDSGKHPVWRPGDPDRRSPGIEGAT